MYAGREKCEREKQMNQGVLIFCTENLTWILTCKHNHIHWQVILFGWVKSNHDLLEFSWSIFMFTASTMNFLLWSGQIPKYHGRVLHTAFGSARPPAWVWIQICGLAMSSDPDASFCLLSQHNWGGDLDWDKLDSSQPGQDKYLQEQISRTDMVWLPLLSKAHVLSYLVSIKVLNYIKRTGRDIKNTSLVFLWLSQESPLSQIHRYAANLWLAI